MKVPGRNDKGNGLTGKEATRIRYIGKYQGRDAYHHAEPHALTGFPETCLLKDNKARTISGFDALETPTLLLKDWQVIFIEYLVVNPGLFTHAA